MNPFSSWFCTNRSKNLFVKIVHPGGRVELHDRPIPAAELLTRNPKCCVAHPTVFRHPHGIVSPTTLLALGQKYYIVPITTIRKLQLKHHSHSNSTRTASLRSSDDHEQKAKKQELESADCCLTIRRNKNGRVKVKNGKNLCCEKKGVGGCKMARTGSSLVFSEHWQPGLESITEE
ncbi:UNVERIFIED_CONTAM: hypothetical protein Scaly_1878200 [Sesamum calycinum]|uniref:DUF4228 domain protein n=1 Tax=Sesamum calycinum TaxID=2727403 RepID=A0AAW2NI61_9LAMI